MTTSHCCECQRGARVRVVAGILLLLLVASGSAAWAQGNDGDLDGTFNTEVVVWGGGDQSVRVPVGTRVHVTGLATQSNGRIVVVGLAGLLHDENLILVRFCRDGLLDDGANCGPGGFGQGGIVRTNIYGNLIMGMAIDADDRIVVVGTDIHHSGGGYDMLVARYCPDGRPDDGFNCVGGGFGTGGVVITQLGVNSAADGLAIQGDGKILVGGGAVLSAQPTTYELVLLRYCPDGRPDNGVNCGAAGFGDAGIVRTGWNNGPQSTGQVALQADDKILLNGSSTLMRFCSDGRPDDGVNCGPGFGSAGVFQGYVSPGLGRLIVQSDGKIVHAGTRQPDDVGGFFLERLCPNGTLDDGINCGGNGFGTGGEVTTIGGPGTSLRVRDAAVGADGKIVAVGDLDIINHSAGYLVMRYCPDGGVDDGVACGGEGFGNAGAGVGLSSLSDAPGTNILGALLLRGEGRIVVAYCINCEVRDPANLIEPAILLTSYCPNGLPDDGIRCGQLVSSLGPVRTNIRGYDQANAVALQADGKIVLAGGADMQGSNSADFALARYCADGKLDDGANCGTGFGNGGTVTTNFASYNDFANAVAIQPDGKIVAAGVSLQVTYQAMALARYCPDGTLDNGVNCGAGGFGIAGEVITAVGGGFSSGFATGLVLQPDGKIVAAGFAGANFALVRYCPDGRLDNGINCGAGGFGVAGIVATGFAGGSAEARALALQPDGKLVVAGGAGATTAMDFALARYCPNGSLDDGVHCGGPGFGTGGKVTTVLGAGKDEILGVTIQPDGKIVAAGYSAAAANNNDFALARYCADGRLDDGQNCGGSGFGVGGILITTLSAGHDMAFGIALQADRKPVLAGYTTGLSREFALARYCTDGRLDDGTCGGRVFGNGGKVLLDVAPGDDIARALAIQSDGKIVVVGDAGGDFVLARFIGSSSLHVPGHRQHLIPLSHPQPLNPAAPVAVSHAATDRPEAGPPKRGLPASGIPHGQPLF